MMTIDYKKLFHSLDAAYIVMAVDDPAFTIIEENEAHARMAMISRHHSVGQPLLTAFPDVTDEYVNTGVSQLLESIRRVIRTGQSDEMPYLKYDLKDKSGKLTQKYWSIVHHPIFDDQHNVVAVYQATEDITPEIMIEQKLARTQGQLAQALSSGSIGTWLWDISAQKVYADKNLAHMFGLTVKAAAVGLSLVTFIQAIHPADRKRVEKEINKALKYHTPYESEYRTINKSGDVRWVIARGQVELNQAGQPLQFPGVIIDITERKTAENNLKFLTDASTQFSATLDYRKTLNIIAKMAVPTIADWCSVELLDDNGQLQQVAVAHKDPKKAAWARRLRAEQGPPNMDEPSGVANVIRTGEPELYPEITDEMLRASAKNEHELQLALDLGISSVIIVPLKIDGRVIGAMMFVSTESKIHYKSTDVEIANGLGNRAALAVYNANLYKAAQREIKERKHLQHQLEFLNEALETRVKKRTKQLEATNAGLEQEIIKRHDAETELKEYSKNLALSNQELQNFAYVASHDLQEPLRKIQAFGDLLETEFGQVLGEGVEYLGRMRGAAARMSVLIEDLLAFSRVTSKAHPNVPVNLNTVAEEVTSDLEAQLNRTGGKVQLAALPTVFADPTHMRQLFQNLIGNALKFHRDGVAPIVKVYQKPARKTDTCHTIYIEDNGIGFEEKYLDRIFSVFQRLHGRDVYEGTGIGLAVCRKIAERYGGTITATSKKNAGSRFIFTIPKTNKEAPDDHH
ncbi:MAG: ATP-binding protein [Candidatus Saccharimonadales bacterium]